MARLPAQWPIGEKVARAQQVITTGGIFDETDAQMRLVDGRLRRWNR